MMFMLKVHYELKINYPNAIIKVQQEENKLKVVWKQWKSMG